MASDVSPPPLFAVFDRIRVINLAHRTDRRAEMVRQLRRVGLDGDTRVAFFPAVSCRDAAPFQQTGTRGCFLSHLTALQEAAEAGGSFLLLEDDCDFVLPDILDFRMPERWDILYGGYHAIDPDNLYDSEIIGSHFMAFSPRAVQVAKRYLEQHLLPDYHVDPKAAARLDYDPTVRPSVDGAYVWMRRAHPELTTIFAPIGVQRASRTDIGELRLFDRLPIIRTLAEAARRLRRQIKSA